MRSGSQQGGGRQPPAVIECSCHEWHDTGKIGEWTQGDGGGRRNELPLCEITAARDIWAPGHFDRLWGREKLTALIREAGGITCEHALTATTYYIDGQVGLNNGIHRWAVATELGITRVPVGMYLQPPDSPEPSWDAF